MSKISFLKQISIIGGKKNGWRHRSVILLLRAQDLKFKIKWEFQL